MPLESAGDIGEGWVKRFAAKSGILSDQSFPLEQVILLFDSHLQARLSSARLHIEKEFPFANDWIDTILSHKSLPENSSSQAKQDLSDKLLDLVMATDVVLSMKDNQGVEQLIAVDVTTNPHKEQSKLNTIRGKREDGDPKGLNRNQNLPLVRRALGFQKHAVLVIDHRNLPTQEALLGQLYAFAHQDRKTDSINLYQAEALSPSRSVAPSKGTLESHPKEKEAVAISSAIRSMLNDLNLGQRQPDGALAFANRQHKYWQNNDTIRLVAE